MKKVVKISLIAIGVLILTCVIIVGVFLFKFNAETKKMHPTKTANVVDNIYAIKDEFVNMYLIKDGDQYIAIDAGKDIEVVSAEL